MLITHPACLNHLATDPTRLKTGTSTVMATSAGLGSRGWPATRDEPGRNASEAGGPPSLITWTCLPSRRRSPPSAKADPRASASGFTWAATKKRWWRRIVLMTFGRLIGGSLDLFQQSLNPEAFLNRRIILDPELRGVTQAQTFPHQPPDVGGRTFESRLDCRHVGRPQRAEVNGRVLEVARGADLGHRHQADPRILEFLLQDQGDHLLDGLFNLRHAGRHN